MNIHSQLSVVKEAIPTVIQLAVFIKFFDTAPTECPRALRTLSRTRRAWYNRMVVRLTLVLSCAALVACSVPKSRDCFPLRSQLELQTPEAPAPESVPESLADIVELTIIARGLNEPVALAQPAGEDERLFVAERGGRIMMLRPNSEPEVFADLSDRVATENREQGLLGLAFHPDVTASDRVFVNYTAREDGASYIIEFKVDKSNPDVLDLSTGKQLIRVGQPWPEHNGGHLAFGRDGKLYIGLGDGGGRGDPRGHAQRCDSWRGKMLRMDVDASQLSVNVIQMGLRNPWRYSFDRKTGDLYIGDVGARAWELLYAVPSTALTGHNFGWNIATGSRCATNRPCDRSGFTVPILEYDHGNGCAIIGGYVYRGNAIPELDGAYFFADFCSGMIRSIRWKNRQLQEHWNWRPVLSPRNSVRRITSFGQDQAGELYILSQTGTVWKLSRK